MCSPPLTFHQQEPIREVEVRHKERRFPICSKTFDVMGIRSANTNIASDVSRLIVCCGGKFNRPSLKRISIVKVKIFLWKIES